MAVESNWHGKDAMSKVERALMLAIDKTTSDGAIEAKGLVHKDTELLQRSIFVEPAKKNSEGQIEGIYGAHDVGYAVFQEFLPGESMPDPPGGVRERAGGKPYLRPSMKTVEKNLPENIAAAYKKVE